MHAVSALRHIDRFGGVVEGPLERFRRWIGIDLAQDLGRLVPGDAVDFLLIRPADGLVCNDTKGREGR